VLALLGAVLAQPRLVIDGLDIPGNSTDLVPGRSYAPARALALALGAELALDLAAGRADIQLGGRVLSIDLVTDAAQVDGGAMRLDGVAIDGSAGLVRGSEAYLPVQAFIAAFGGSVAYVAEEGAVVAVLPRAELTGAVLDRGPDGERLRLTLSRPTGYSTFFNAPVSTLQLRIERTSLARAQTLLGDRITRVDLIPSDGAVDVRVGLPSGSEARVYTLAGAGGSFELIVDLEGSDAEPVLSARARIVIDPGHGGEDAGLQFDDLGTEGDATLAFAFGLATELEALGLDADLTRDRGGLALDARLSQGIDADLFVSVHGADLPPGRYNLYYLGDAADGDGFQLALRANAETALASPATDAARRAILLGLTEDLELGRRYAGGFERELLQLTGLQAASVGPAPLYVLTGAAGRGLLLELSPTDLADPRLPGLVARALLTAVSSGGVD
jgi:N-acetylmuramoyl-L-alanine amidase